MEKMSSKFSNTLITEDDDLGIEEIKS